MEGMEEINNGWGGPQQPQPPPQPTMEEWLNQLMQQVVNLRTENAQMRNEVQDLRQGNRGRPGALPYRPDPNYYSIPRPPGWGPPPNGPMGEWDANDTPAFLGVKPTLMKTPEPFEGEHNDMDRFIGDCHAYFEVFRHQFMGVSSLMVVFATSLFKKRAQDWWTHRREDLWTQDPRDPKVTRY